MALTRPCLGCRTLIRTGSYCRACRNTTGRGYGHHHQQRAHATIAAHPYCSNCGATTDLTADHVVPVSDGGAHSQLRTLCRPCNSRRANQNR